RQLVKHIDPPIALAEVIQATLVDDPPASLGEGVIRSGVDAELDELRSHSSDSRRWLVDLERRERERTGVKNLKVGYNRVFGYYLEVSTAALRQSLDYYRQQESGTQSVAELLQRLGYQRRQTLASAERFVTDELRDHEARQARSAARTADLERQAFEGLCEHIAAQSAALSSAARTLAEVDALASLAQVAHDYRYVRPEIVDDSVTEIVAGRHPMVEAAIGWDAYIADDAFLAQGLSPEGQGEPPQVMVLTGPNMAGKTTFGRMVLLVALMGQCGSFVPAQRARLGIVDRIFLRSGAGDDIAGGQSTFMAEMTETAAILRNGTSRSLAFFDEVGRGTSTYDGMAIARSIVERLADPDGGCRTIFSTHYHELAAIEAELPTAQSFRMDVLETQDRVVFTYRVVRGGADRSYGVHVAQLAGLPASIIARAAQVLRDLEAGGPRSGEGDQRSGVCDEGNGRSGEGAAAQKSLLYELADVNLDELTPLEGLNTLASLQRAVRRWLAGHGAH
ncbi:MAG: DNA mismatch repair protein MutS, partial [Chloroflexi bacterium]|nr:DNA mismatch repair protein MutS [Chloroflexota bacterium]